MTPKDYEIAMQLKNRLSEVVELLDFRFFGSRVRGTNDKYSDLDVFLEVELLNKDITEKISDIVWEVGFKHSIVITPLIFTRYEIEKSPLKVSSIITSINGRRFSYMTEMKALFFYRLKQAKNPRGCQKKVSRNL